MPKGVDTLRKSQLNSCSNNGAQPETEPCMSAFNICFLNLMTHSIWSRDINYFLSNCWALITKTVVPMNCEFQLLLIVTGPRRFDQIKLKQ